MDEAGKRAGGGRNIRTASVSWHVEDWESAKAQMLNGAEPPLLDAPQIRSGQTLRRFPTALKNFYDIILNIRDNGNCSNYNLYAGGWYYNHVF